MGLIVRIFLFLLLQLLNLLPKWLAVQLRKKTFGSVLNLLSLYVEHKQQTLQNLSKLVHFNRVKIFFDVVTVSNYSLMNLHYVVDFESQNFAAGDADDFLGFCKGILSDEATLKIRKQAHLHYFS